MLARVANFRLATSELAVHRKRKKTPTAAKYYKAI